MCECKKTWLSLLFEFSNNGKFSEVSGGLYHFIHFKYSQTYANNQPFLNKDHLGVNNNQPEPHPTKTSTKFTLFIWAPSKQQLHSEQRPLFWGPKGGRSTEVWLYVFST